MPACELRSLTVANGANFTLGPITLSIEPGQCLGIIGENGSGKSTLLNALIRPPKTWTGQILLNGQPSQNLTDRLRARLVATVPQSLTDHLDFTVRETVALGRTPHASGLWESPADQEIIDQAIKTTNLQNLQDRPLSQISGGERQRTLIARALAQQAQILTLDEPTSHLDIKHHRDLQTQLASLKDQGKALVVTSHDINWLIPISDKVLVLKSGNPLALQKAESLDEAVITQAFEVPFTSRIYNGIRLFEPV